ncbi:MAG: flavodoxin family protein [Anaerolineae bacterium]
MGKVLVLYDSRSGNTEAMATLVAEGAQTVPGIEVRLLRVDDATADDALWADGIACGTPTYVGLTSWKMKKYWDDIAHPTWGKMDGKIGCAFSTSGGWGGGAELTCMSILIMMMNVGMLTFGVTDYTGPQFTLHYGAVTAGEPREEKEREAARRLGKRLAQWVAYYVDGRADQHPGPMKAR